MLPQSNEHSGLNFRPHNHMAATSGHRTSFGEGSKSYPVGTRARTQVNCTGAVSCLGDGDAASAAQHLPGASALVWASRRMFGRGGVGFSCSPDQEPKSTWNDLKKRSAL